MITHPHPANAGIGETISHRDDIFTIMECEICRPRLRIALIDLLGKVDARKEGEIR